MKKTVDDKSEATRSIDNAARRIGTLNSTDLAEIDKVQASFEQVKRNISEVADSSAQLLEAARSARSRHNINGIDFDLIDYEHVARIVERCRREGRKTYITLANPHSVVMCRRDKEMRRAIQESALTLPDGIGIVLAARLLGYQHKGRVTGPMLMLHLCDRGRKHGYRHFFYGGQEHVPEELREHLNGRYPALHAAGSYSPPFRELSEKEDEEIVGLINSAKPDILWVGLGTANQEKWMNSHIGRIEAPVMIGVGAAFDFHSGNVRWAPAWIRAIGMEWAFRWMLEPRRMCRRNFDSLAFLAYVIRQRIRQSLQPS